MWNQGGGYNESSTMGGGYTQSPGGFASPALSQGGEKKRTRATQIIPCTVSQMMSASQADEAFRVGDVEVSQVTIVGIIRSTDKSMTNIQYKVDDMTTAPMDVKQWVDTEDPGVDSTVLPPGTYVKVSGNLRSFQNHRSVVAFSVKPLENMNEITSHMLEVVQAHMALGKPQSGAAVGGGGGGMSSNVTPPPRALTESTRGSYAGAHDMVNNGLSANQNQKAQRNKLHHTLLSYFLPLPHYNYDLDENSLHGKVLCLIRGCPEPQGISIQDLKQRLNVMSMAVIKQAVEFLSNEGHIFSTIDEDHFKSTDSDE